jgi:hypothetical protein|tara:strand:- start:30 stop:1040 length:1011 start_codon:yes stop_codon:yes gene_type:complete
MYLEDLIPTPNSTKVAAVSQKVFGRSINVESLTKEKAKSLRETFAQRLDSLETKLGANIANNPLYLENKLFLETIDKYLGEDDKEMSDEARELELWAENDGPIYKTSATPIMRNLSKKFKNGTYDPELGVKLWKYHADRAAKGYSQEYSSGDDWKTMFTPAVRMEVAKSMEASWRAEMEAGNFMESAQATESVIVEGMAEVSEVVLASKNMVDKMQAMVEDLGEMVNEDLPALTDSIRNDIDSATADQFSAAMSEVVSNALEVMRMSREGADAASRILTGEQIAEPESIGAPIDGEMDMEPTTDMDMDGDIADEEDFASADAAQDGEEELGRERRA